MAAQIDIRVGRAGNGTPVFMATGHKLLASRVFGAVWDSDRSLWMYPAFFPAAGRVIDDLAALSGEATITWSEAAQRHTAAVSGVQGALSEKKIPADFTFVTPPYEHQIEGLCHVFYNLRAALFYDPGLGKSKIAVDLLRLLRHGGNRAPALVLGPRVTVQNWGREIDRHSGGQLTWIAVVGTPAEKKAAIEKAAGTGTDILLATYDTVRSLVDFIVDKMPYGTLICDECHQVKAWDSSRTKATWEVAQKAARRVMMTGSPTQGSPLDLYGIYKILGDCFMPEDYRAFKHKFLEMVGPNSHVIRGYKNLDILNARTTFLSARKRKEECLDLPERTTVDVEYHLTAVQTGLHNQLVHEMRLDPEQLAAQLGLEGNAARLPPHARMPHRAATLSKLLQVASGFVIKNQNDPSFCDLAEPGGCRHLETCIERRIRPRTPDCQVDQTPLPNTVTFLDKNPKLDALEELLDEILEAPAHKVIVWCSFKHELDLVQAMITRRAWRMVRVDGESTDVQACVDAFNNEPDVRVYLSQTSTGVGITLNAATYMVYCSLPFSLNSYIQSIDRNYRIGQTNRVTVYRLIGRGTPEAAVAKLLDNKVDVDALLTKKIDCVICPNSMRCLTTGIEPFDPDCIYPRKVARPVIRAHALNILPENP